MQYRYVVCVCIHIRYGSTEENRECSTDMLCVCVCIDIRYGGTGENRDCSKGLLFIGELFVETTLVMVKQNSDLL